MFLKWPPDWDFCFSGALILGTDMHAHNVSKKNMRLCLDLELITAPMSLPIRESQQGRCSEERDPEVGAFGRSVL